MALGRAQAVHRRTGQPVTIVDQQRRPRWHELWDGAPGLGGGYELLDAPGARPYIRGFDGQRFHWRRWPPTPATIVLTAEEEAFGRTHAGRIVIEDSLKPEAPPNKQYPRWSELLPLLPAPLRVRDLGVGIRLAAAVIKHCRAYVGHEGALHHLAAAFDRPAVVIMGGYVGVQQTGYDLPQHRYLTGGAQPCGVHGHCDHCAAAMAAIEPQAVISALREVMKAVFPAVTPTPVAQQASPGQGADRAGFPTGTSERSSRFRWSAL